MSLLSTSLPVTDPAASVRPRSTGIGLAVVGGVMLVNGAAFFVPLVLRAPYAFSENGARWEYQAFHVVYLLELVVLALVLPGLAGLRGRTGRTLPKWLLAALTGLVPLQAGTVFTGAFIVPFLADVAPASLDVEDGGVFAIAMGGVWVLWSLALLVLGVVGAARRVIPVAAAAGLAVGAVLIPVLGPAGSILVGAGLAAWGARAMRSDAALPAVPAGS